VAINLETPYVPLMNDGKTPNLRQIARSIEAAVEKAVRRGKRLSGTAGDAKTSMKSLILDRLPDGIAINSDGGRLKFNQRNLYYKVRELIARDGGPEVKWEYFTAVITGYEEEHGDIRGMYRDPRGTLYHPHTGEEIPLGTQEVDRYRRPAWTFNKILYCEKEGLISTLRAVRWPERNDCALVSSKGYASRAARDVFDALGETDEPITFYCVHDCDAYGTMIYQTLQGATKARAARRVEVVNLGLDVAEALAAGLPVEPVERKGAAPVADYAEEHRDWFQAHRVELNAMTPREFLGWLDAKFAALPGKVVPPADVLRERLETAARNELHERLTAEILEAADLDGRVDAAMGRRGEALDAAARTLAEDVAKGLADSPTEPWSSPVERIAEKIAQSEPSREPEVPEPGPAAEGEGGAS
jgi:hypothetical protein